MFSSNEGGYDSFGNRVIVFTAKVMGAASGRDSRGNLVTSNASATATSNINVKDAFEKATLKAQNAANSQLKTDINVINKLAELHNSSRPIGVQGFSSSETNNDSIEPPDFTERVKNKSSISPSTTLDVSGSSLDATITIDRGMENHTTNIDIGYQEIQSNTAIGYDAGVAPEFKDLTNCTSIGFNAICNASNQITLGNSSVTSLICSGSATLNGVTVGRGSGNQTTNTSIGLNSLQSNTFGLLNTSHGFNSLSLNTNGSNNTSVGGNSLRVNTTGSQNTASGVGSLRENTSGNNNTSYGYRTLQSNTIGCQNTAGGIDSLQSNTTGHNNTAYGTQSLSGNSTGSNNTGLGYGANSSSNAICNEITLGNSSITALRCHAQTISTLSDQRDKKDIEQLESSLSFVEQLNPVRFNWNMRDGGKVDIPEIGFIAQDLQKVQLDTGMNVPNLVYDINPDRLEASYATLLPLLVKSIQELSLRNQEFAQEIQDLKKEIVYLNERI